MNTATITPETLSNSVIAVPPLARDVDLNVCATENAKIMRHLEAGAELVLLAKQAPPPLPPAAPPPAR